jgi:hypothetical protein
MLVMWAVVLFNIVFLYLIGSDALKEKNSFQFFADSNTYHKISKGEYSGLHAMDRFKINVSTNYLGPVLILDLLGNNIYCVMLLNSIIFYFSMIHISKMLSINPVKVCLILFMSPMTISSILSINKEIFLFAFLAFAMSAYIRRSFICVVMALAISILVRWEMAVFYIVFLTIAHSYSLFTSRRQLVIVLLVMASIGYVLGMGLIQPILDTVAYGISIYEEKGSGIFEIILNLQNKGLYFLVFPFKAAQLLFALGVRIDKLLFPSNIYNDVFIVLHSFAALVAFMVLVRKKRLSLQSDLFFVSVLYLIVFCLTPIFAPRYLYFVFILWVLIISGAPSVIRRLSKPQCHGIVYNFMRVVAGKRLTAPLQ